MGSVYRLGWLNSSTQQVYATQSSCPHTSTLHSPDGKQVINAPRQTDRWTDKQTDRWRDGQTKRQTDKWKNRHQVRQSGQTCSARAWTGVTKTHLESGAAENVHRMANSAQMVLPLPVRAPTNASSSVL